MAWALFFGVAGVSANLGLQSTSTYLIAKAAQHPATILLLWVPIVAVRCFGTARGVLRYAERLFAHDVTLRWLKDLRVQIYAALEPLPPARRKGLHTGDLLMRIGADVDTLQALYISLMAPVAVAVIGLFAVLGLGLLLNATLAVLLVLLLAGAGLVLSMGAAVLTRRTSAGLVPLRVQMSRLWVEMLDGLLEIVALNLGGVETKTLKSLHGLWRRKQLGLHRLAGCFAGLSLGASLVGMWLLLRLAVVEVRQGHLHGVLLPVVALFALAGFELVNGLPGAAARLGEWTSARMRTEMLCNAPPPAAPTRPAFELPAHPTLTLSEVTVVEDAARRPLLDKVCLTLRRGEHVAVVGPNGSGKSTLLAVLTRMQPFQGRISMDGEDLTAFEADAVRTRFGIVNQFPYVFDTTLRDNLLLARPEASTQDVFRAVELAGLEPLLRSLPQGLDSRIGQGGAGLSGGETKRLAIARVVLKGAPILLLDEPTESLDAMSEDVLLRRLLAWADDRTVLWVTHRARHLAWLPKAALFDQGRLVAMGPSAQIAEHPLLQRMREYRVWSISATFHPD